VALSADIIFQKKIISLPQRSILLERKAFLAIII